MPLVYAGIRTALLERDHQARQRAQEVKALQRRCASGSSAGTSYSRALLPAAAWTHSSRRQHSSSRDPSSAEETVREPTPSTAGRRGRLAAARERGRSILQRGKDARSRASGASAADSAAEGSASDSRTTYSGKRHATEERNTHGRSAHSDQSSGAAAASAGHARSRASCDEPDHAASRSRGREAPAEGAKPSRRTRQLEAMAAEMLREDEAPSMQPAAPPKQRPVERLKFPA